MSGIAKGPAMLGHNNGPSMEAGRTWRRYRWAKARAELLPKLPIETVRRRIRRAKEIGLDYTTYASVRAASGHDVIAFLYSTNALRMLREGAPMPAPVAAHLEGIRAHRGALAVRPLRPEALTGPIDSAHPAPNLHAPWSEVEAMIAAAMEGRPRRGTVIVGDAPGERAWATAARAAAYLPAEAALPV